MSPDVRGLSRLSKAWVSVIVGLLIPTAVILVSLTRELEPVTYASTFASAVLLYLAFMYWEFGDKFDEISDNIKTLQSFVANTATIVPIREPDFYEQLDGDIQEADNHVWISYLDNKSPLRSHDEEKVDYYENLGGLIRKKSGQGVEFRRIVRAIPSLDSWIREMMEEREGISRYSLACLPDENPDNRSKPHVSVQIIDDDITYFVAVGEQQETNEPRDMFVRSMELNDQWGRYYQRMWDDSFVILRRGQVQEGELEDYEEHLESLTEGGDVDSQ